MIHKEKKINRISSILLCLTISLAMLFSPTFANPAKAESTLPDGVYIYLDDKDVTNTSIVCYYGETSQLSFKYVKNGESTDVPAEDIVFTQEEGEIVYEAGLKKGILDPHPAQLGQSATIAAKYQNSEATLKIDTTVKLEEPKLQSKSGPLPNTECSIKVPYQGREDQRVAKYIVKSITAVSTNETVVDSTGIKKSTSREEIVYFMVTPKKQGKTTLVFRFADQEKKYDLDCTLNGKEIYIAPRTISVQPGESKEITFFTEDGVEKDQIQWSSSDSDIADVKDGVVTAKENAFGTAKITAALPNGESDRVTIKVYKTGVYQSDDTIKRSGNIKLLKDRAIQSVTLTKENPSMLVTYVKDGAMMISGVSYLSDNTNVVTGGTRLTAVANGTANIYVYEKIIDRDSNVDIGRSLAFVLPVTVTGMDKDAPDSKSSRISTKEAPTGDTLDYFILCNSSSVESDPASSDNSSFESFELDPTTEVETQAWLQHEIDRHHATFQFTLRDSNVKGPGSSAISVEQPKSEKSIKAYTERLKSHLWLANADGEQIQDALSIRDVKIEYASQNLDAVVTVSLDQNKLKKNQTYGYQIVFDMATPFLWNEEYGSTERAGSARPVKFFFSTAAGAIDQTTVAAVPDQAYTGKAITPALQVSDEDGTLEQDKDYTVEWENNTSVGTATATIKGIGEYEGTKQVKFTIVPADITHYAAALKTGRYTYNGKAKKPAVRVSGLSAKNYTVTYQNNKKIGRATVTIRGTGGYQGSITKHFSITPAKAKLSRITKGKNKLKVKIKKQKGGVRYQLSVKKRGSKTKHYTVGKKASKTLKKLKSGKKVTVKARAFKKVNGKMYYGAWSKAKTVTVK